MKFRKKPIVIEAEPFFPDDRASWPDGLKVIRYPTGGGLATRYELMTLEGMFNVVSGNWIVTGIKGERYPIPEDIFKLTYEKVEDEE